MEQAFIKSMLDAGMGAAIALVILIGLYRLANRHGQGFVSAQQKQAEALGAQAQSLEGLTRCVEDFVRRDSTEHREMLVMLRFMSQQGNGAELEAGIEHIVR